MEVLGSAYVVVKLVVALGRDAAVQLVEVVGSSICSTCESSDTDSGTDEENEQKRSKYI